jgi:hypothetical protein
MSDEDVRRDYERAMEAYERVLGRRPTSTGSPAWFASDRSLRVEAGLGFRFASDCRGTSPFLPLVEGGRNLELPQVPITFPTLDEVLGLEGQSAEGFNDLILRSFVPGSANVHTAHAEAEGRVYLAAFESLLDRSTREGWRFITLGELLDRVPRPLPQARMERGEVKGRAGEVSIQAAP